MWHCRTGRSTTAMYQAYVAGKPRLAGARAALEHLGVPNVTDRVVLYAERKQKRIMELIEAGSFAAFPDALRFIQEARSRGLRLAAVSSSKNANRMMEQIHFGSEGSLLDHFEANLVVATCAGASHIERFFCLPPGNWECLRQAAS